MSIEYFLERFCDNKTYEISRENAREEVLGVY